MGCVEEAIVPGPQSIEIQPHGPRFQIINLGDVNESNARLNAAARKDQVGFGYGRSN